MKPLRIDFVPNPPRRPYMRWLAGGIGALCLTVVGAAWLPAASVEASHMAERPAAPSFGEEEAQAVNAAVRELNLPWPEGFAAIEAVFGSKRDVVLHHVEADIRRATLRLSGKVRDGTIIPSFPASLRAQPGVADVRLLGQEAQNDEADWPVRFVLELSLKEGA